MKSFAVTVLVFLNTSLSTEMVTELRLKRVYSKNWTPESTISAWYPIVTLYATVLRAYLRGRSEKKCTWLCYFLN